MDKNHKDPHVIDSSVPRRALYLQKVWKGHQDSVYWIEINLAIEKGLNFFSSSIHAQRPEVKQLSRSLQSNQPIFNPSRESFFERRDPLLRMTRELCKMEEKRVSSERTERAVVDHDNLSHEQTMLNETDIDFLIPGLRHSL